MRIDLFSNDAQILTELGSRLKHARLKLDMTQDDLAKNSGIAKSTIERAEKGQSIQFLSLIKILRSLNSIGSLETLLPETQASPLEIIKRTDLKKRVKQKNIPRSTAFTWGDDK
ncbi:helix-turn-helix transcriptional regulator [Treponema sp.]|uniref:helix-turn-helix domain-containing protein n=1 Tax=Treponema sp. TaxID=166 RepID=UPI00298E2779|nr:helix-turn-helix transcriptional regulator [Treponema sp.]MCR5614448.1 helix-turn-helix domain-containing protein [Treponema sp.]